jgi:AraC-like DNA-binding protein
VRSATYLHRVLAGTMKLRSECGDAVAGPGGIIWIPAGLRVGYGFPGHAVYWTLRLRSGAWTAFAEGDCEAVALMRRIDDCARANRLLLPLAPSTSTRLEGALEELLHAAGSPAASWHRPALKGGALRLLGFLGADPCIARRSRARGASGPSALASRRIAPALERLNNISYITESGCTVESLAALCGYRPSRFHARFVEATGTTPIRYLNERRVALACEFLGKPHQSILEVAFASGFSTQSRFYAAFKQLTGRSPGEWRRTRGSGSSDAAGG